MNFQNNLQISIKKNFRNFPINGTWKGDVLFKI